MDVPPGWLRILLLALSMEGIAIDLQTLGLEGSDALAHPGIAALVREKGDRISYHGVRAMRS